jgi:transcription antitermination factor NusG
MQGEGWNVLRIKTGQELNAHELFARDHVLKREGVDLYTPFTEMRQRPTRKMKAKRERGFIYAKPVIQGWLIARPETPAALARMMQLIDDKPYLYGFLTKGDQPYVITDSIVTHMRDGDPKRDESGQFVEKRWKGLGRSYDPKRDSRKNRKRIYAQSTRTLPELEPGEVTRMLEGPFQGIDMTVQTVSEEWARVSFVIFGSERTIDAPREELQKTG